MGISQSKVVPLTERNTGAASVPKPAFSFSADVARQNPALEEDVFHSMLTLERRRAERSRQPFVLMLLDAAERNGSSARILLRAIDAVALPTRETDLIGWYKKDAILGIIFTEVATDEKTAIPEILRRKIAAALSENLGAKEAEKIAISVHLFPEDWSQGQSSGVVDSKLYSNLRRQVAGKRISLGVKRAIDILGSGALLLLMSPILAVIALAIKLTSEGPVLFEQERLGRLGVRFKCLKFRTMYTNCNPKIHQDYIQEFISGKSESTKQDSVEPVVYKITNDPRITAVGRLLRKTSLDELPQFWNVLRNDMSLVGPRPPVPYEFEIYDIWHRRRVLEVKPGITGLWQVSGRSRTRFDDMVRLDLRYCQSWSLWLDIKILFATPFAVFSGDGAY
jgi:lipopolysaccharide/colanic/teichoic acid biosynthesis glycosyltransferase